MLGQAEVCKVTSIVSVVPEVQRDDRYHAVREEAVR